MVPSCPESEKPRPKRAGPVLTDSGEGSESGTDSRRHVVELPADLVFDAFGTVRLRKPDGPHRIGRTEVDDVWNDRPGAGRPTDDVS